MLMDLPLFKGVGKDQISYFLEKTNIDFLNYSDSATVVDCGDLVKMIKFVISGRVRIIHPLDSASISVEEIAGFGRVLGAERLFGITTGYPYRVEALGKTSVMEFSKEQYVNLLHSDRIYILNFFNYLSLRAQRPVEAMMHYSHDDIRSRLCVLISMLTDPGSAGLAINATDEALAGYCGKTREEVSAWKGAAQEAGLITVSEGCIRIRSRMEFLDV